jgi:polar amino acid transport system substrate-binding protein
MRLQLLAAAGLLLVACSGASPPQAGPSSPAPVTASPTPSAASDSSCGDPRASLRPSGPLPPPDALPAGTFMQQIRARGKLVVGVSQDTLRFGYRNPGTGEIEGFDIDMLKAVARAIFGDDSHITYHPITDQQRIPAILDGSADIVAQTMTINCARWKLVDFTTVYYDAGQRVLVLRDSNVQSIDNLGNRRVCATKSSTSLDHIAQAASQPIPFAVDNWTDCLVALQRGEVDAISTDDAILAGLQAQDPGTKIVGDRISDEPYGLAINQGHPEFVRFVNAVLERMRADGTWAAIYARWLSALGPPPAPPPAMYRD